MKFKQVFNENEQWITVNGQHVLVGSEYHKKLMDIIDKKSDILDKVKDIYSFEGSQDDWNKMDTFLNSIKADKNIKKLKDIVGMYRKEPEKSSLYVYHVKKTLKKINPEDFIKLQK